MSGDLRMIHNLSDLLHHSINDFMNPELWSVRNASIDDAVKMVNGIGKRGKLSKAGVKNAFRLLISIPIRF